MTEHRPAPRVRFPLVVFDLDGTLVDSRRDIAEAANRLVAEYGGTRLPEEEVVRMVGEGVALLVERATSAAGIDPVPERAVDRFMEIYGQGLLVHTRAYPGIPEVVRDLSRSTRLAVLTNKPRAASVTILDALGLAPFFWRILGGDGPWARKPDPEALRHLMAEAGVAPGATVLVGDSLIDLHTSRNAGTRICLARYGFGYAAFPVEWLDGTELAVDTPSQLPSVLGGADDGRLSAARRQRRPARARQR
jgi:phosphoglycolate phosphatase